MVRISLNFLRRGIAFSAWHKLMQQCSGCKQGKSYILNPLTVDFNLLTADFNPLTADFNILTADFKDFKEDFFYKYPLFLYYF